MSALHPPPQLDAPPIPAEARLCDIQLPADVLGELDRFDLPTESRQQVERDYKLSLLYGGRTVVIRETPDGTDLLKGGPYGEVADWLDSLTPEQRLQQKGILFPVRWSTILRDLRLNPARRWWRLWLW